MSDKMPDIIDQMIDRLPPSIVKMVLELKIDSLNRTNNIDNIVNRTKQVKVKQIKNELEKKISHLKSKTVENKKNLVKLKNELEVLKSLKEFEGNQKQMEAYKTQIKHLEIRLKTLFKESGDIDLTELFNDVENLNLKILDYQKKISEAKNKYQFYDNFPPSIEEAKETLEKIKERVKEKQENTSVIA